MNNDAKQSDTKRYAVFFREMLEQGIYLPPSQFECIFISLAHTEEDFRHTATAMEKALAKALQ